jgi:hypothetical protein
MNRRSAAIPFLALLFVLVRVTEAEELRFAEMYTRSVLSPQFTPRVLDLNGKQVTITGFMAPPLRVQGRFLVLTRDPVSLCPFCNSDADWPMDIVVVYLKKEQFFAPTGNPIAVTGQLEVGSYTDPDTGFVSRLRLVDASYRKS